MAIPCTKICPNSSIRIGILSCSPTEVPPDTSSMSVSASMFCIAVFKNSRWSGTISWVNANAPASCSRAASMGVFTSRILPGSSWSPAGTSSSPVEITPTFGCLKTSITVIPIEARVPISAGFSFLPTGRIRSPGLRSSPLKIMFAPGGTGFTKAKSPPPKSSTNSIITIASAPWGKAPPVGT